MFFLRRDWRRHLNPRDPDYLDPEEDGPEDEEDEIIKQHLDDWPLDNPEDDFIMTDAEKRGDL